MKLGKILFFLLVAVIVASAVFMMLIPSIVSSDKGRNAILSYVNHAIPGRVDIQNLNIAWTQASTLQGVELKDEQGKTLVKIDELSLNDPFWKLALGLSQDLSLNVKQLNATVISNESGTTNIERALSFEAAKREMGTLLEPIDINNVNVTSVLERGGNLSIQGTGQTKQGDLVGGFKLDGSIHDNDEKSRLLNLQAQKLPTLLIDQLAHLKLSTPVGLLQKVMGNEMNLNAQVNGSIVEAQLTTPFFSTKAEGLIENEIFKLKNPLVIQLKLSPESASVLHQAYPQFQLEQFKSGGNFQFEIPTLEFPLEHPEEAKFTFQLGANGGTTLSLQGKGTKDDQGLQFLGHLTQNDLKVEFFKLTLDETSLRNLIRDKERADITGILSIEKLNKGSLGMKLAETPFSYKGSQKSLKIEPKVIMDRETIQGTITAQQVGEPIKFDVNLKGLVSALQAQGTLSQGFITLAKPLKAEITLTKGIGDHFLDEFIPLLDSASHADYPLQLTISNEGFSVPLDAFSKEKLKSAQIGAATLDLKKIYFTKDGKLAQILSLLKLPSSDTFSVWFTPIYVSMNQGVLQISRFDMLVADKAPIASWGKVDFPGDAVKMNVGLTGKALTSVVGILPLPKNYMLSLPLKGPLANPKLDTKIITAKLAGLAAMATGPQGMLVGALVNLAAGTFSETIPEPTTQPLPWTIDADQTTEETQPEQNEKSSDPTKAIKKEATKIINNLFGK